MLQMSKTAIDYRSNIKPQRQNRGRSGELTFESRMKELLGASIPTFKPARRSFIGVLSPRLNGIRFLTFTSKGGLSTLLAVWSHLLMSA